MSRIWHLGIWRFAVIWLLFQSFGFCWSLNDEGKALLKLRQRIVRDPFGALSNWIDDEGEVDPCNWFGVECSDRRVVILNLRDLCLGGTLAPELANLAHIKSIILRNNSLSGIIPESFIDLKELEVLDLGYNNFSGPIPKDLGSNFSLAIFLLDNNGLLGGFSPEITRLMMLSEYQVDENHLAGTAKASSCTERPISWNTGKHEAGFRRILEVSTPEHSDPRNRETQPPPDSPASSPLPVPPDSPAPSPLPVPSPVPKPAPPSQSTSGSKIPSKSTSSKKPRVAIIAGVVAGVVILLVLVTGYLFKTYKIATVKPWATGLSGQLQKAFVTGAQKLKRSELEAACEDFSNVISTFPSGIMYKGTLSSGVEIAVASVTVTSSRDWSKTSEKQYRKKIDALSKVNHKNFVNLLGYCEEEEPFTRMVVFEYAPNGTLFEHLHVKESEHLDWVTRLRVAMGMAYCLQHMHKLKPPIAHSNLNSSSVYLTDDYAAKISDLSFLNEIGSTEAKPRGRKHNDVLSATPESNIYSFGVMLLEIVTGRLPCSEDNGSFKDWASNFLRGNQPLREMVDPTLVSFHEEQLAQVAELIKSCVHSDSKQRPTMHEVSVRLKEITKITPDAAVPKLNSLWWAELEICSADGS